MDVLGPVVSQWQLHHLFNYLYLVPRVFLFARVTYFVLLCCITGIELMNRI